MHLRQLGIVVGQDGDDLLFPLQAAFSPFEIKAGADFTFNAGDGVIHFGHVGLGNNVEGRHGNPKNETLTPLGLADGGLCG
jgi:hypothetical protein